MKKTTIFICLILLFAIVFINCSDADYKSIKNSVYIEDAKSPSKTKAIPMDESGAKINVYVRLARVVDHDVEVEIKLNPDLVDLYNEQNATEYNHIPNFKLPENTKAIIPTGAIGAPITIEIPDFETQGKQYGIGVELGKIVKGNMDVMASLGNYIYTFAKPIETSVPVMKGYGYGDPASKMIRAQPATDWGLTTQEWSLECHIRMSGYSINNQAIFNAGSKDHEIYIRFGDANRPYNYLQIKTLGGQTQSKNDLEPNKWYHWAFVYDGKALTVYRNGAFEGTFDPPAPKDGAVRFDYFNIIASSGSYFYDQCAMGEVRLWKKAITASQIKNNMYYSINPENPDLIGYWPMNEGAGNTTFKDITGNGHDAIADVEGLILRWEENVRFDK